MSRLFSNSDTYSFERMIMERAIREADLLEQQQKSLLRQAVQASERYGHSSAKETPVAEIRSFEDNEAPVQTVDFEDQINSQEHDYHTFRNTPAQSQRLRQRLIEGL